MNLVEKIKEYRENKLDINDLIGSIVTVKVYDYNISSYTNIKGNYRGLQSNGDASIKLESSYKNRKGKHTDWIKISKNLVELD